MFAERDDYQGDGIVTFGVKVTRYRNLALRRAVGIAGQPQHHYYFHRPLNKLLAAFLAAGFVVDGREEPAFDAASGDLAPSWNNCTEIPPILVARLRGPAPPNATR